MRLWHRGSGPAEVTDARLSLSPQAISGPACKTLERLISRGVLSLVWRVLRAITSQLAKTPKDPHGPSKTVRMR
jgi:hypothetical protein